MLLFPNTYIHQNPLVFNDSDQSGVWKQFIGCFTADDDYDLFGLQAFSSVNHDPQYTQFDKIELIEDRMDNLQTEFNSQCNASLIIGEDLCDLTNLEYSWWDVTNPLIGIQLTQGGVVLVPGVTIPPSNTNGSQLQVSSSSNKTFKLKRSFISTNGYQIVGSGCDKEILIDLIVESGINITKEVLTPQPIIPGTNVDFQITIENNSGASISNLQLNDILNSNLIPSSVVVNPDPNVIPLISGSNLELTIVSLADGASQQIDFSVDLLSNASENVIENCVTSNYFGCEINSCISFEIEDCYRFDLMIKDNPTDVGLESNPGDIWNGDIWNCSTTSSCTSMQSTEYSPSIPNFLKCKIYNVGCIDYYDEEKAKIHLYWTIGRSGEIWPDHWDQATSFIVAGIIAGGEIIPTGSNVIPSIPVGGNHTISMEWDPPNPADFPSMGAQPMICYLARIVDDVDVIVGELPGPIANNVRESNNIATINTTLVDLIPLQRKPPSTFFLINNPLETSTEIKLNIKEIEGSFFTNGNIEITIDRLLENGKRSPVDKYIVKNPNDLERQRALSLRGDDLLIATLKYNYDFKSISNDYKKHRISIMSDYRSEKIHNTNFLVDLKVTK